MFCPFCGTQVGENARFCRNCGKSISKSPKSEINNFRVPETDSEGGISALQVYAGVMLAVFAWFFLRYIFLSFSNLFSLILHGAFVYNGILWGIGYLLQWVLRILQSLLFAFTAVVMYAMVRYWKREDSDHFALIIIFSAGLSLALALLRMVLLLFTLSEEFHIRYLTWLFWIIVIEVLLVAGYFLIVTSMGLRPEIRPEAGTIFEQISSAAATVLAPVRRDTARLSEKNRRSAGAGSMYDGSSASYKTYGRESEEHLHDFDFNAGNVHGAYTVPERMALKTDYSLVLYIILGLVTCCIYDLYVLHCIVKDINKTCAGDGEETPGLLVLALLILVTCGIYAWIFFYKLGNRMSKNALRYGLMFPENGTTILLWMTLGSMLCGIGPLIAWSIILKNTNELNAAYNRAG